MRAIVIDGVGESPRVAEVEQPRRGPGEALVRMETIALNPVEVHIWAGRFFVGAPCVPYVPGVEGVGVVEEGDRLALGTRVRVEVMHPGYGRDGLLGEYAVLPETPDESNRASQSMVFPLANGVEPALGAALGATGYTALMLLDRAVAAGAAIEGAHVALLGGTGAVGQCVLQLAKTLGAARVVVVGRDPVRLERATQLGADAALALDPVDDLRDRLLAAAEGRLDIVMDPLWGEPAVAAIEALTDRGVYVSFGQVASTSATLPSLPLRNQRISLVGHSSGLTTPDERREVYDRVHELAAGGRVVVAIDELALEDVPSAWDQLASSATAGTKLVVRIPAG
jgi:NADPH2:quinone reductase